MAKQEFSKEDLIKQGWKATKSNVGILVQILLVFIAISAISSLLQTSTKESLIIGFVVSVASTIVSTVFEIGMIKIALNIVDRKKADIKDLYQNYPMFLNFFLSALMYGILVVVGFILLIVPGIYLAVRYQFYSFILVDKKLGPIEALRAAGKLTQGRWMQIFLFDLLLIGLNILGAIALGVGLLLTIPTSFFAAAYLYRKLSA